MGVILRQRPQVSVGGRVWAARVANGDEPLRPHVAVAVVAVRAEGLEVVDTAEVPQLNWAFPFPLRHVAVRWEFILHVVVITERLHRVVVNVPEVLINLRSSFRRIGYRRSVGSVIG